MNVEDLQISDFASLLAVVLSVVSLVISVLALRHQREANLISLRAFEAENFPQVVVETNILAQWMEIWSENDHFEPTATVIVKNKGKESVTIRSIGTAIPGESRTGYLMFNSDKSMARNVPLPHKVSPWEKIEMTFSIQHIESTLRDIAPSQAFTFWVSDSIDQEYHSKPIDRKKFSEWSRLFVTDT